MYVNSLVKVALLHRHACISERILKAYCVVLAHTCSYIDHEETRVTRHIYFQCDLFTVAVEGGMTISIIILCTLFFVSS